LRAALPFLQPATDRERGGYIAQAAVSERSAAAGLRVVTVRPVPADLGKIGQMRPGEIANFRAVSTGEAVAALHQVEGSIAESRIALG